MLSIWEKETYFAPQDVVIIGSGFVGLWSALHLKKAYPQKNITILERGLIPSGASSRNAGFACFGSPTELLSDLQQMGESDTLELVEWRYKGLESIEKHFGRDRIGLEWTGGYELYEPGKRETGELKDELAYLNKLLRPITKLEETFSLENDALRAFGFGNTAQLVKNPLEGGLHSGKLLQSLVQEVSALGVQVLTGVSVRSFAKRGDDIELHTNLAQALITEKILVCTNALAKELAPELDIIPARGQVLLTAPVEDLSWSGTFHAEEGYYYFRNLGNRVLLGGARHKDFEGERTTEMTTSALIQEDLEQYLRSVVLYGYKTPVVIEHRWSGIMGMGVNKMPTLKALQPNIYCAVGMGGMGVALAPVIGEKAVALLRG